MCEGPAVPRAVLRASPGFLLRFLAFFQPVGSFATKAAHVCRETSPPLVSPTLHIESGSPSPDPYSARERDVGRRAPWLPPPRVTTWLRIALKPPLGCSPRSYVHLIGSSVVFGLISQPGGCARCLYAECFVRLIGERLIQLSPRCAVSANEGVGHPGAWWGFYFIFLAGWRATVNHSALLWQAG